MRDRYQRMREEPLPQWRPLPQHHGRLPVQVPAGLLWPEV